MPRIVSRGALTIVRKRLKRRPNVTRTLYKDNLAMAVARGKNNIVIGEPLR